MRSIFFTSMFHLLVPFLGAQNLVPNPSFEEYVNCPNDFGESFELTHWFRALATPDYFNACAGVDDTCGVPKNFVGFQQAATGSGYLGMVTYSNDPPDGFRELMGVKIDEALIEGRTYYISFKVSWTSSVPSPDGWMRYAANKLGIRMRMDSLVGVDSWYPIENVAQFASSDIISDSLDWTLLSGSFIASETASWLYLGNFFDHSSVAVAVVDPNCPDEQGYYYIDDVCLSPSPEGCPTSTSLQDARGATMIRAIIAGGSIVLSGLSSQITYWYEVFGVYGNLLSQGAIYGDGVIPIHTTEQIVVLRLWDGSGEWRYKLPVLSIDP